MGNILRYLRNFFYKFGETGIYKIENNQVTVRGKYLKGQYIKIEGSVLNDGVFKVTEVYVDVLTLDKASDEEFTGAIYSLAVPPDLIELESKIKDLETTKPISNISSESFGNYSYTRATNKNGEVATWKDMFSKELMTYRKIYDTKNGVTMI